MVVEIKQISIANYRSIAEVNIPCKSLSDGSITLGLIGLNEAGKSSILKAVALFMSSEPLSPKEFFDRDSSVSIELHYVLEQAEIDQLNGVVKERFAEEFIPAEFDGESMIFSTEFAGPGEKPKLVVYFNRPNGEYQGFVMDAFPPALVHTPVFWTASDKYLISKPIGLSQFSSAPLETSVPLRNCFLLAGITDIPRAIAGLQQDSTENEYLVRKLGRSVTDHIRTVWPNHPIEITFLINGDLINFHVKDLGADRPKTADQRSDGFRQFVSFLLTVSAQNKNEELTRSILLLDEPETHLHPLAQEQLLNELIRLTNNHRQNVVIFATHSNYMIDKRDLSRNFRVFKKTDQTEVIELDKKGATYASVTYEVFDIASSDYHNELYSKLQERYQEEDPADQQRLYITNFDKVVLHERLGYAKDRPQRKVVNQVTLPTYIRNCIHHPDNGDKFTDSELRASIELLRAALV